MKISPWEILAGKILAEESAAPVQGRCQKQQPKARVASRGLTPCRLAEHGRGRTDPGTGGAVESAEPASALRRAAKMYVFKEFHPWMVSLLTNSSNTRRQSNISNEC